MQGGGVKTYGGQIIRQSVQPTPTQKKVQPKTTPVKTSGSGGGSSQSSQSSQPSQQQ